MSGELNAVLYMLYCQIVSFAIYLGAVYFIEKNKNKARMLASNFGLYTLGMLVTTLFTFLGSLC